MAEKIYILGGGFGGIYSAMELEHGLAGDRDIEITLVNCDNFFLFTPMLPEAVNRTPEKVRAEYLARQIGLETITHALTAILLFRLCADNTLYSFMSSVSREPNCQSHFINSDFFVDFPVVGRTRDLGCPRDYSKTCLLRSELDARSVARIAVRPWYQPSIGAHFPKIYFTVLPAGRHCHRFRGVLGWTNEWWALR